MDEVLQKYISSLDKSDQDFARYELEILIQKYEKYVIDSMSNGLSLSDILFGSPEFNEQRRYLEREVIIRTSNEHIVEGIYKCRNPSCGSKKIKVTYSQTRRADEMQTQYFECVSCDRTWKQ